MSRRNWTSQEDQHLKVIVDQNGNNDWTLNAEQLALIFGGHRSGKQCRERWYNHLKPNIYKTQWSETEVSKLFHLHEIHGNKWKKISDHFPGRTDNCVKNHFYSILRKSLRRFNKYLGEKNSTEHIRNLKPNVLTQILNFMHSQKDKKQCELAKSLQGLPSLIYSFSHTKPVKSKMDEFDRETVEKIRQVVSAVDEYNKKVTQNEANKTPITPMKAFELFNQEPESTAIKNSVTSTFLSTFGQPVLNTEKEQLSLLPTSAPKLNVIILTLNEQ